MRRSGKVRQNKSSRKQRKQPPRERLLRDMLDPKDLATPVRTPEYKVYDANSGGYIAGTTYAGLVTTLFAPAQGVTRNQRVGDAARMRAIDFRIFAYPQGSSTCLRFILFVWNQDTSVSAPTIGTVLQSGGTSPAAVTSPYEFQNVQEGNMFIVHDETLACITGGAGPQARRVEWQGQLPVTFDNGVTTGVGKLHLLVLSDAALAGNAPQYQYWSRVLFDDY